MAKIPEHLIVFFRDTKDIKEGDEAKISMARDVWTAHYKGWNHKVTRVEEDCIVLDKK